MADTLSMTATQPKYPNVLRLAELLRSVRDFGDRAHVPEIVPLLGGTGLGELLLGEAPEGIERAAYGERLTKGSGQTLQLRPDVFDAASLAAGPAISAAKAAPRVARAAGRVADEALQPVGRRAAMRGAIDLGGVAAPSLRDDVAAAVEATAAREQARAMRTDPSTGQGMLPGMEQTPREIAKQRRIDANRLRDKETENWREAREAAEAKRARVGANIRPDSYADERIDRNLRDRARGAHEAAHEADAAVLRDDTRNAYGRMDELRGQRRRANRSSTRSTANANCWR